AEVKADDVILDGKKPTTVTVDKNVENPTNSKGEEVKPSRPSTGGSYVPVTDSVESVAVVDGSDGFTPVTTPVVGQVIRANITLSDGTVIGTYPVDARAHYKWYYEGGDTVLGTESSYTVTSDNAGKKICLEVTVDGFSGSAVWTAENVVLAPTASTVSLVAIDSEAIYNEAVTLENKPDFSAVKLTVSVDESNPITLNASGILTYVTGFTGFNQSVVAEQSGYYVLVGLEFNKDVKNAADDEVVFTYGGKQFTAKEYKDVEDPIYVATIMRLGDTKPEGGIKFTVDWDGSGTAYTPTEYTINLDGVTLKPVDPPVTTYTVTYDANGATSGSVPTDGTAYAANADVTVLGNTGNLEKIGYNFIGWNTKADGSGTSYTVATTFKISANTTLYAAWEKIVVQPTVSISKANMHDTAEENAVPDDKIASNYNVLLGTKGVDGVYPVTITAKDLKKHTNGANVEGYWIGFGAVAPADATGVKFAFAETAEGLTALSEAKPLDVDFDSQFDNGTSDGWTFYTDATDKATAKLYAKIQWVGADGDIGDPITFKMNIDGVELHDDVTTVKTVEELKSAIAVGGEIRLGADISDLAETLIVADGKSVTLDLNGKVLTLVANASEEHKSNKISAIRIEAGASLILKDSVSGGKIATVELTSDNWSTAAPIDCFGTFVMDGGTIELAKYNYWAVGAKGPSCNMTINSGIIDAGWTDNGNGGGAIAANGTAIYGGYTVTINEGAKLLGGETTLYFPSKGTVEINGGEISSKLTQGIAIRAGSLTINGGTISSNGARVTGATSVNGGTGNYTGALTIVRSKYTSEGGYNGDITVNIKGGTLSNSVGDALVIFHETGSVTDGAVKVEISSNVTINGDKYIQDGFGSVAGDSLTLDGAAYVFSAASLKDAVSKGGKVVLGTNISLGSEKSNVELVNSYNDTTYTAQLFIPADKDVTLALNGNTISTEATATYMVFNCGTLTVDGSVAGSSITAGVDAETEGKSSPRLFMNYAGTLNLNGGHYDGYYAVNNNVEDKSGTMPTGTIMIRNAEIVGGFSALSNFTNGTITANNTTIKAYYYGLVNNGTYGNTNFDITGGTITSNADTAIYFPAGNKLTLTDVTVSAPKGSGIEAFAGAVELKGNTTISAGAAYQDEVSASGEGSRMDGSAVLLGYRAGYKTFESLSLSVEAGVKLNSTYSACIRLVSLGTYDAAKGVSSITITYDDTDIGTPGTGIAAFLNNASSYGGTVTVNNKIISPPVSE
ncbi:InlB B-repeat-containing protein, partial [Pseudoflavonifractor phocaeensis]|uniref:InlB B-repeat-containing protein n=1 Tax=Pseudoflavonifractor phocaeensis TaxID=1870988 RepID=UPI00210B830D